MSFVGMVAPDVFSLMTKVLELAPRSQEWHRAHKLGLLTGMQKYENFIFLSCRGKEAGTLWSERTTV